MELRPEECESVLNFLTLGREACTKATEPVTDELPSGEGLDLTRQVFLSAILGGQRHAALNIVEEALRAGHSHVDIYVNVFTEALHRVGELWELNKISVAQEHIATAITQYAIAAIYPRLVPQRSIAAVWSLPGWPGNYIKSARISLPMRWRPTAGRFASLGPTCRTPQFSQPSKRFQPTCSVFQPRS